MDFEIENKNDFIEIAEYIGVNEEDVNEFKEDFDDSIREYNERLSRLGDIGEQERIALAVVIGYHMGVARERWRHEIKPYE